MLENTDETTDETLTDGSLFEREFFGVTRHNLIAGTAENLLTSQKAKNKVRSLLEPLFQTMADVGGWADEIKLSDPPDDADTRSFLADERNANHHDWHFVNLPLGAEGYDRTLYPDFTRDDDVVQIIKESVEVLLGNSNRFSELNAFRLICHLIGDIHQPIHVGCGYIEKLGNTGNLVFDPIVIRQKNLKSDRGGNSLLLPVGSGLSLHSYWDSKLGGNINNLFDSDPLPEDTELKPQDLQTKAIRKLLDFIQQDEVDTGIEADDVSDAAISPTKLAEIWTTASIKTAQEAYFSLKIEGKKGDKFTVSWEGKEKYDARCVPLVIGQMKAAARNLAFLLDQIWK